MHKEAARQTSVAVLRAALLALPLLGGCAWLGGRAADEEKGEAQAAARDRSQQRVRVFISGVSGEMRTAVSRSLELKGLMSRSDASDALVRRVYGRAAGQMSKALQPFGHYHAKVEGTLELQGQTWFARFKVDPGPPTLIAETEVKVIGPGGEDRSVQRAVHAFRPDIGEVLDHRVYEASKLAIADALADRGYLDAEAREHRVAVRLAEHSARIHLQFDSGDRHAFGPVRFVGAQLPEPVLRGYLPFRVGQPYRTDRLIELQQRLLDADYFSEVEIETRHEDIEGLQVPIEVRVTPAPQTIYTGGLTFGTDSGFGVQGGITRRWVNERGHKASGRAELGQRLTQIGGQYQIPIPGEERRSWSANLGYRDEETDTSTQKITTLFVGRQRETAEGTLAVGIGAQSGDFEVGDLPGKSTLWYPEIRFTRRQADELLAPREGWALQAEARVAPGLGGDVKLAQLRTEAKLLRPHGERNRWLARVTLGALWTDDFDRLPPQLRFFAGGDRNLRGFDFQGLGPKNTLGKVKGGRYLAVGSLEYERHLFGEFGVAGFADAGNAFDAGDFELAAGLGVGLRWRSPLGLVRVDLATPVAGDGDGLRLHLMIGPEL
jgi:translocation and assembly module TamA